MQKEIKYSERECDGCHKKATYYPDSYGGHPFDGWLVVKRKPFSNIILENNNQTGHAGPWDFCCYHCAVEFLAVKEKEQGLPALDPLIL